MLQNAAESRDGNSGLHVINMINTSAIMGMSRDDFIMTMCEVHSTLPRAPSKSLGISSSGSSTLLLHLLECSVFEFPVFRTLYFMHHLNRRAASCGTLYRGGVSQGLMHVHYPKFNL